MKLIKLGLLMLTAALFAGSCSEDKPVMNLANANSAEALPVARPAATIDELASGRKVYEQNCVVCHKGDGTGGKIEIEGKKLNPEDLTTEKIKNFSDAKLVGYVVNGVLDEGMPAFKDKLSEGEIRDVVMFIRKEFHRK